jgi:hypothetical protein
MELGGYVNQSHFAAAEADFLKSGVIALYY